MENRERGTVRENERQKIVISRSGQKGVVLAKGGKREKERRLSVRENERERIERERAKDREREKEKERTIREHSVHWCF